MKRIYLFIICSFACGTLFADDRPNVLFLFSDDHALRTIGAYEGSINETPNLSKLASQSMSFKKAHVNVAICASSRSV